MIAMWLMSIIPCRSCRERCGSAAAQATVVPESGGTDHAQIAESPSGLSGSMARAGDIDMPAASGHKRRLHRPVQKPAPA